MDYEPVGICRDLIQRRSRILNPGGIELKLNGDFNGGRQTLHLIRIPLLKPCPLRAIEVTELEARNFIGQHLGLTEGLATIPHELIVTTNRLADGTPNKTKTRSSGRGLACVWIGTFYPFDERGIQRFCRQQLVGDGPQITGIVIRGRLQVASG